MGGRISVSSELGRGTTFSVRLPHLGSLVETDLAGTPRSRPSAIAAKLGRLLIVDDEARLARTLAELITDEFEVTIATSAERARELLAGDSCDVCMPGESGLELHERLLAEGAPMAARFVFMTGALLPAARDYADENEIPWVEKPIDYMRLLELLRARRRR
jgi:DNA-binding NtrC family response regulator